MEMEEASSSSQPAFPVQESIYVRGVPLSALDEDLKNHFERYGEVVWGADMHDVPWDSDGKTACVVFADPAAVNWALASWEKNNHIILGKKVEVTSFSDRLQGKIEMFDLPPSATCSLLRDYFQKFGVVTEAYAAPNGWGCVVFNRVESAHQVLRAQRHLFCGTEVSVLRPSLWSITFLDTNASLRDLASATSPIPCASRVIPKPLYIDMRCFTPYDAPSHIDNAPSYNQPTIAIPHTYNASTTTTTPLISSTSNNQSISATTNASGAPSVTPFGAPYTSSNNRPTSTTTSSANNALSINPYSAPHTPSDNQLISAPSTILSNAPYTHIYGTPSVAPFGAPYTFSHNRPINPTSYANSAPYDPSYNQSISATTNAYGAPPPPPPFIPFNAPYTSSYNRPINTTSYAKSVPNYTPFYNQPITNTPHAYGALFTTLPLHNPMSTTQNANTAPYTFFYDPVYGPLHVYNPINYSHFYYYHR